jgi:LacI family transcriptional regulator
MTKFKGITLMQQHFISTIIFVTRTLLLFAINLALMKKERATVYDIAKELKITASTVSRALNDHPHISARTKKAVKRVSEKLSYQPHGIAAALRNGRSNIIGVIVPAIDRNFFASIIRGIEEMANKAQYQIMICQTYEDPSREAAAIETLLNARVDGVIASLSKKSENFSHYRKVKNTGIPLILFDRANDELGVSQVVIDDFTGSYKAVEHLIQQGCKRIAHFTSFEKINIYKERLRGYKAALENHGLPFESELVIESDLQLADGRKSMEQLLLIRYMPDAVFSTSDLGAMGALQVLKERNIRIPHQVALVGFSNEPFTMFCDPPLTSIDQHCKRMGNMTSEIFLEEIKASGTSVIPRKVVLMPEIIIRESSLKKKV